MEKTFICTFDELKESTDKYDEAYKGLKNDEIIIREDDSFYIVNEEYIKTDKIRDIESMHDNEAYLRQTNDYILEEIEKRFSDIVVFSSGSDEDEFIEIVNKRKQARQKINELNEKYGGNIYMNDAPSKDVTDQMIFVE